MHDIMRRLKPSDVDRAIVYSLRQVISSIFNFRSHNSYGLPRPKVQEAVVGNSIVLWRVTALTLVELVVYQAILCLRQKDLAALATQLRQNHQLLFAFLYNPLELSTSNTIALVHKIILTQAHLLKR